MLTATAANAYAVESKWTDPDTGEAWLHFIVHDLDFTAYAAMPAVLSCEGMEYRKMGFNTDTGRVAYKRLDPRDLATAPKEPANVHEGRPSPRGRHSIG